MVRYFLTIIRQRVVNLHYQWAKLYINLLPIEGGSKRLFPNQATWPSSRFYPEFHPPGPSSAPSVPAPAPAPAPPSVTTLFTLRPLDNTATSISEMKVMSDNSRIVKTNRRPGAGDNTLLAPLPKLTPISEAVRSKDSPHSSLTSSYDQPARKTDAHEPDMQVNCKLLFPKGLGDKAILTFDNGQSVQLDRSLFQHVENPVKMFHVNNQPRIKTTIVNRDKTFKTGLKKKKRVVVRKAKPAAEGPLTQAQLMSAVISKRLNFSPPASSSKYPSILPKPSPPTTNLYTTNQEPQISPAYQMKGEPEQKIFYRNM